MPKSPGIEATGSDMHREAASGTEAIMRTLLALAVLGATAVAAPVPKEAKADDLVGLWKLESKVDRGQLLDLTKSNLDMSLESGDRPTPFALPFP